jgi:hypothetical protein
MPIITQHLWHAHSKVLNGFYMSDVYVAAMTKEQALQLVMVSYDEWLANEVKEFFYDPLTQADPDEKEYQFEAAQKRGEFEREMTEQLQPLPANAIIIRKT